MIMLKCFAMPVEVTTGFRFWGLAPLWAAVVALLRRRKNPLPQKSVAAKLSKVSTYLTAVASGSIERPTYGHFDRPDDTPDEHSQYPQSPLPLATHKNCCRQKSESGT